MGPFITLILFSLLGAGSTISPPSDLRVAQKNENAIQVAWTPPSDGEGENKGIRGYKISARPIFSYSQEKEEARYFEFLEPRIRDQWVVSLSPGTNYEISIITLGQGDTFSSPVSINAWTRISYPEAPPPPTISWDDSQRMGLSLFSVESPRGGPITSYRLALVDELGVLNKDNVVPWKRAKEDGYSYYIAAEWKADNLPSSFTVGDSNTVGGFFNGPIPPSHSHGKWRPTLGAISTFENVTKIQYSPYHHYQSQHQRRGDFGMSRSPSGLLNVDEGRIPQRKEDPVVKGLWIAIGIALTLLLIAFFIFLVIKYNILFRNPGRGRRETVPLSHSVTSQPSVSTISVPYSEFDHYNHYNLAFVAEEENSIHAIPRAEIASMPEDAGVSGDTPAAERIGRGKWGPVFSSILQNSGNHHVHLYQLPSPTSKSKWDEELYRAVEGVLRPSSHVNLASLRGFFQTEENLYIVAPGEWLPLKTELIKMRGQREWSGEEGKSLILCAMGVAEGLFHLHSYMLTHGDICAWNVVLQKEGDWENPKLTGFGVLSYSPEGMERDKRRWMSAERLHNLTVSPSDSWAFGVLVWEIATLGATPFFDVKGEELKKKVERGARPQQVENIGDGLYQLMLTCWQLDREERPTAETLACQLHSLLPNANEELGITENQKLPPYSESLEFVSTK